MTLPPSPDLIDNLKTRLEVIEVGDHRLPMTINDGEAPTGYICCPSEAYIAYAHEELRHFSGHPWLKKALSGLIDTARPLLALSGLDRQVQPNNWLLSTNILPDLSLEDIQSATQTLIRAYPDHAIVWRSVSDIEGDAWQSRFRQAGYQVLAARRINIYDARTPRGITHRDEVRDQKLLSDGLYDICGPEQIRPEDHARIAELYARLYLEKYTPLNPAYSEGFMKAAHDSGMIEFYLLKTREGRIDGVLGLFSQGQVMTAPIVGYDTALAQSFGLYRRLMAIGFSLARERKLLFNMSAGAATFKHARGAFSVFEYNCVYVGHLRRRRQWATAMVAQILKHVGEPMLTRFEL